MNKELTSIEKAFLPIVKDVIIYGYGKLSRAMTFQEILEALLQDGYRIESSSLERVLNNLIEGKNIHIEPTYAPS